MPRTHARRLVTQLVAAACLVAVGVLREAQAAPQHAISVVGQVTAEGDRGIPIGVTVFVETYDGKSVGEFATNGQGQFRLTLVPAMLPYRLTVKAAGYYPIQQELDLRERQAILTVTVRAVLTPIPGAKRADEAAPTLTDQSAPRKARKAYEKGVRAVQAHDLPDAQSDFSEAVAVYPCYARAQTGLAALLIRQGDLPAGEAALHKAIQCDPNFPHAFVWLGRVLNSEGRFTESVTILQQGLRLSPKAWELYDQLAAAHYSLGSTRKPERNGSGLGRSILRRPSFTPGSPWPTCGKVIPKRPTPRCKRTCRPNPKAGMPLNSKASCISSKR